MSSLHALASIMDHMQGPTPACTYVSSHPKATAGAQGIFRRIPIDPVPGDADAFDARLAAAHITLFKGSERIDALPSLKV